MMKLIRPLRDHRLDTGQGDELRWDSERGDVRNKTLRHGKKKKIRVAGRGLFLFSTYGIGLTPQM